MNEDPKNEVAGGSETSYPLSRDFVDCTRLNLQHHLWRDVFGYLLHPGIDATQSDLRVADIGTGTAIWLTELSKRLPSTAKLDGFDVDTSQAPPREWLPSNVKIKKLDIFSDLPEDVKGQYDVVHVRLLVFVIRDGPLGVLRNLLALLKPGGWLQWGEPDIASMRIMKTNPSNSVSHLEQLWSAAASVNSNLVPTWPQRLQDIFEEEGLMQVRTERVIAAPHIEYAMHECNLLIYDMIAQRSADATDSKARQLSALVSRAASESKHGVMFAFPRLTMIGRKASL